MQFLCDVPISYKLVNAIENLGFKCIHVIDILDKWYTKDAAIAAFVDDNDYILITKDVDFRNSFFVKKTPKKLIKINLGNSTNQELIAIVNKNIGDFKNLWLNYANFLIEVDAENINFITTE